LPIDTYIRKPLSGACQALLTFSLKDSMSGNGIHLFFPVCLAISVSAVSCSKGPSLNLVQGKVVHNGQPEGGAKVVFHPAEGTAIDWPAAITEDDGTFVLKTGERMGAAAGSYKVAISRMEPSTGKPDGMAIGAAEEVDQFKGAYSDPATSKFSIEIKPGTNQLEPFTLQ
jgi:hypothetical protein